MDNQTQTTQFNYAGFWKRFAAFLIDFIILVILGYTVGMIIGFSLGYEKAKSSFQKDEILKIADILGNIIGLLVGWIYYSAMESSLKQATFGKMALGIKVTNKNGQRISFTKATGRHFGKIISVIILGIGFLMVAFTEKKQGLHDKLADCLVVNNV